MRRPADCPKRGKGGAGGLAQGERSPLETRFTRAMRRVLEGIEEAEEKLSRKTVHALRVSIRRSRSVASGMREVDPEGEWAELSREGRRLFRRLGALRDFQIMLGWVRALSERDNPVRAALQKNIRALERAQLKRARRALGRFDSKRWRHWAETLSARLHDLGTGKKALERIAEARFAEVARLHRKAVRRESIETWHELRIAVKRFRYTIENFFPERYSEWGENLEHIQDLLGEVHDLDVLADFLPKAGAAWTPSEKRRWLRRIEAERCNRLVEYRKLAGGRVGFWKSVAAALTNKSQ